MNLNQNQNTTSIRQQIDNVCSVLWLLKRINKSKRSWNNIKITEPRENACIVHFMQTSGLHTTHTVSVVYTLWVNFTSSFLYTELYIFWNDVRDSSHLNTIEVPYKTQESANTIDTIVMGHKCRIYKLPFGLNVNNERKR